MKRAILSASVAALVVTLVVGCGGGGGDAPAAPTPLPATLSITPPPVSDLSSAVQFGSNASSASGLRYEWNFGDGSSSNEANPKHVYAKAGDYDVQLTLSNEAGQSRSSSFRLKLSNKAHLAGRVCSAADSAGWCWQAPLPSGVRLQQASFVSSQLGWVLTDEQQLSKTVDGGLSWQSLRLPEAGKLHSFSLVDASKGWVLAADGGVWRTDDGGVSFRRVGRVPVALGTPLIRSYGPELLAVAEQGLGGTLWVSSDGGVSWLASGHAYTSVAKDGSSWRLEASTDGQGVRVWRSMDLGLHETQVSVLPATCSGGLDGNIVATSQSELLSMDWEPIGSQPGGQAFNDRPRICRSTDGGQSWMRVSAQGLPTRSYSRIPSALPLSVLAAGGGQYWAVYGRPDSTGAAMFRSGDGGETWTGVTSASGDAGISYVANASTVLSYSLNGNSSNGNSWISTDAGASWQSLKVGLGGLPEVLKTLAGYGVLVSGRAKPGWYGYDVWQIVSPRLGTEDLAQGLESTGNVGTLGSAAMPVPGRLFAYSGQTLLRSSDFGRSWQAPPLFSMGGFRSLQFASASTGWAVADFGLLFRTRDGGASWLQVWAVPPAAPGEFGGYLTALNFSSETEGLLAVLGRDASTIYRSSDGGQSWTERASLAINVTQLLALENGDTLAAGPNGTQQGGIYLSKAGSAEFSARYLSDSALGLYVNRLRRQPGGALWAVGAKGLVLSSTDGGQSWLRQDVGVANALNDIQFADALHGWIVGDGGLVLASVDGGKTWTPQASLTTDALHALLVQDAKTVWAVGENGTVLATGTGGD